MALLDTADHLDSFPDLFAIDGLGHGFVTRHPDIDVNAGKAEVLQRLGDFHRVAMHRRGLVEHALATAQQVHGGHVARVDGVHSTFPVIATDGLISDDPEVCLGIYVADCAAVYLVDPVHRALGLLHSGRKGTELGIVPRAIEAMQREFGTVPKDLIVQISPCIRPPYYEVDFAARIRAQAAQSGVQKIHDCGVCTAARVYRYYSYRMEKGRTGRMLAFMGWTWDD